MESYKSDFVLFLADNNCILRNKVLKSGRVTPIYFNFGGELYSGKNIGQLAKYYAHALQANFEINEKTVLFGPAMKGVPLVTETACAYSRQYAQDIRFGFNRQTEKDHGEGGLICGSVNKSDNIIIIDDVFTTGETKNEIRNLLTTCVPGVSVTGILIAIDRKEMNSDGHNTVEIFSHETGVKVCSVITIDDVLEVLQQKNLLPNDWKEEILKERAEYGC